MKHPVQALASCRARSRLYLGVGSSIHVFDFTTRTHLASWTPETKSPILKLKLAKDGTLLALVTAADKTLHIVATESLELVRKLQMPKRPCALDFTSDNTHVLVGDKFGDVYAIPVSEDPAQLQELPKATEEVINKFKPTANELTVHSARNLRALSNQIKQWDGKPHPQRQSAQFPYEPIVGHVSMLTDVLAASCAIGTPQQNSSHGVKKRDFIVTCDRDEHIRVVRSIPQAHVIERFCLGHTQFISRICLVQENILISGGGDDYLAIWNWTTGELLHTLDVREFAKCEKDTDLVTVAGLWHRRNGLAEFFCGFEASPILLKIDCTESDWRSPSAYSIKSTSLSGNVLDLAFLGDDKVMVAIDTINLGQAPPQENQLNGTNEKQPKQVEIFNHVGGSDSVLAYDEDSVGWNETLDALSDEMEHTPKAASELKSFLYNIEALRKRTGGTGHVDIDLEDQ